MDERSTVASLKLKSAGSLDNLSTCFFLSVVFRRRLCTLVKKSCPQRQVPINSLKSNKSGHHSSPVGICFLVCLFIILFYLSHVEKKQDSRATFFGDYSPSCLRHTTWPPAMDRIVCPVMHKSLWIRFANCLMMSTSTYLTSKSYAS